MSRMFNIRGKSCVVIISLVCAFSILQISGCSYNKDEVSQNKNVDYDIGVIHTSRNKGTSQIDFLKKTGDLVTTEKYNYGYITPAGFANSVQSKDMLYLSPLGRYKVEGDSVILGINLNNTNGTAYKFGEYNIGSFQYGQDNICISNGAGYDQVDCYSIKSKETKSIQCADCIISSLAYCNHDFYAMKTKANVDKGKFSLCKMDFDKTKCLDLLDLDETFKDVPQFLVADDQMLYFTNGKSLYCFDTKKKEQHKYELAHANSYNLKIVDHILYVGCTDIHNGNQSNLDIYELKTGKLLGSTPIDTTIMQMEVKNNVVYLSDLKTVDAYQLNEKYIAKKQQSVDMNIVKRNDDSYVCGFFLKNN